VHLIGILKKTVIQNARNKKTLKFRDFVDHDDRCVLYRYRIIIIIIIIMSYEVLF
jgi:hypothetical protein